MIKNYKELLKVEIKEVALNVDKISRQRNLFMGLCIISSLATLLLSARLATFDQRIVMVPGLEREISITNSEVSKSYLEETALLFLSHLLDVTPHNIKHKRDLILKYTSHTDPKYTKRISQYFVSAETEYTKFDLSTHFTAKNLEIDAKNFSVIANGVLTSWYGKTGHENKELSYQLSFEFSNGFLRLKEFNQITKEGDKK